MAINRAIALVLPAVFLLATPSQADSLRAVKDIQILGFVENVSIGTLHLEMTAKLDTGAATSSVHAHDVEVYTRGERDHWVRFRLMGKNGRTIRYDQNVIRFANIKTDSGGFDRRPVIRIPLCLGDQTGHAEVNLADREDLNYDFLVGREFLAGRVAVDSGRSFISDPDCDGGDND